ncbi:ATP-binding cassette domain-containing protein [Streptomyces sp. AV19]|uniref:ABC transporter ATP-binding protein n=1 Tax=Streptomyces sp. AV19 TaxID=2793068 RepID=UPI002278C144|nr:ATP-binding cassette domain-containing protein [Streptomyces sp. AV19]
MRLQEDAHAENARISTRAIAARLPAALYRAGQLGWRADRRTVLVLALCTLAFAALTAVSLHATAALLAAILADGSAAHRLHQALPVLVLVTVTAGGSYLADAGARLAAEILAPKVNREADLAVITASVNAELGAYENPVFEDGRFAATKGAEKMPDLISGAQSLISSSAQLLAAVAVVATLNVMLLPLLLLAVFPRVWGAVRAARLDHEATHRNVADTRLRRVLAQYTTDRGTAAELRSNTMGTFLVEQYRIISGRLEQEQRLASRRAALIQGAGDLLAAVAQAAVWTGILYLTLTGRMPVAVAATTYLVVRTANAALADSVRTSARLFATSLYVADWSRFLDGASTWTMRRGTTTVPVTGPGEIQAKGLTFTYPGKTTPAVRGIDLTIRRGEVIALIGENGSGKTTLAKLLTGLYLPASGEVTWDGQDLAHLDPASVWRTCAVVPQDYTRWPLAARENITLGQPRPEGDHAVHTAAEQAGADTVLNALPDGLDTSLARSWWGGHDLSGGQWQRIAIARAFHRDAPVIVLDEPTSALDARAEHRILSRLRELAAGRTALFITHRLANARTADRIIVLRDGTVAETGTYPELLARDGGLFNELHRLQEGQEAVPPAAVGSAISLTTKADR